MHINNIKEPESFEYQGVTLDGNIEFYITISEDSFLVDFFDKNILSMQEAHIDSIYSESDILEEVVKDAQEYILN